MKAIAEANTNIALVKYWGKNDEAFNLPAVPSLSLTLEGLRTHTEVSFDPQCAVDELTLNGQPVEGLALDKVSRHLDRVAHHLGRTGRPSAKVCSDNNFPTAAGLASSASAFAALTVAATAAMQGAGWVLDDTWRSRLSLLARQGSGSASRSLFGGIAVFSTGTPGIPETAAAHPILGQTDWSALRMVIGVATEAAKATASTDGMRHTSATSPYFPPFVAQAPEDLRQALAAVHNRDLAALGKITERSALRMHASALAADPAVVYLRGATIEGFHALVALRKRGVPCFFTCDAGPHPKALTTAEHAETVAAALLEVPGVLRTLIAAPGPGARILSSTGNGIA